MNATNTADQDGIVGRVIDGMMRHRLEDVMDFVALGAYLRAQLTLTGWAITRLIGGVSAEKFTVTANLVALVTGERPYPYSKMFVVIDAEGDVVADADSLRAALGAALMHAIGE